MLFLRYVSCSPMLSPDGGPLLATVISGSGLTGVKLWGAEPLRLRAETDERTGVVTGILFSPDNERWVTALVTGAAHVSDARTAKAVCELKGHEGAICTIAYSPDTL